MQANRPGAVPADEALAKLASDFLHAPENLRFLTRRGQHS